MNREHNAPNIYEHDTESINPLFNQCSLTQSQKQNTHTDPDPNPNPDSNPEPEPKPKPNSDSILSNESKNIDLQNKKIHITKCIKCCEKNKLYINLVIDHIMTMHTNGYRIEQQTIINEFTHPEFKIKEIKSKGVEKTITFEAVYGDEVLEIIFDWTLDVNKIINKLYADLNQIP